MAKTKPKAEINWTCTKCGATVCVSENLHAPLCPLYRQEAVEKPHEQGRESSKIDAEKESVFGGIRENGTGHCGR